MPPVARPEPHKPRVIAHVDMDCFYVQVEQRRNPALRGLPTAVVQYNAWKGGGLIAVGYEARNFGVKRSMRGDDAKKVCPDIQLVQVPVARGKADLNVYRSAGSEVVSVLATKGRCERASIDEVYLDLTDSAESMLLDTPPEILEAIDEEALKSHVLGLNCNDNEREKSVKEWFSRSDADHQDKLLACGAIIVAQLRMKVLKETEFTCSAGIAHNKMLAKLASAMHKPARQTVVPTSAVHNLLVSFPVKKMKQLGGKLGNSLQADLGVNTVGDLLQFSKEKLQELYGVNTGTWLWNTCRGINGDEVVDRLLPKSHGCGKTFPGRQALKTLPSVENWLNQLCEELSERIQSDLDVNKRIAHTLTLHVSAFRESDIDPHKKFPSKSCPLRYGVKKIQEDANKLFDSALLEFLASQNVVWGVTGLSVTASKIMDIPHGTCSISRFLEGRNLSYTSSHGSSGHLHQSASLSSLDVAEESVPSTSAGRKGLMMNDQELKSAVGTSEDNNVNSDKRQDKSPHKAGRVARRKVVHSKSSILRFLQSSKSSVPATKQASDRLSSDNNIGRYAVYSESELHSGPNQDNRVTSYQFGDYNCGRQNQSQNGNDEWAFDVKDIDLSIVDELPEEIQREVRGWLHPPKRANTSGRGSSIAHYFLPAKKS